MKFIFMPSYKSWFQGLGLHHASITLAGILIGFFINPLLGDAMAMFFPGMYFGREFKEHEIRSNGGFEVMDFVSPVIMSSIYLVVKYV